jgi:hypothetical protein
MIRARVAFLLPAIFVFLGCASKGSEHVEATERTTPATVPTACDDHELDPAESGRHATACPGGGLPGVDPEGTSDGGRAIH